MSCKLELKYEILYNCEKVWQNRSAYRIRALQNFGNVKRGDIGGYVGSPFVLSQSGHSWIADEAYVGSGARIEGDAQIFDSPIITGGIVEDGARIYGNARVMSGHIFGNAQVFDDATLHSRPASIGGSVIICGSSEIVGGHYRSGLIKDGYHFWSTLHHPHLQR